MPSSPKALRSVRIDSEVMRSIKVEAEAKGVSFSAHLSSILKRYAEWNKVLERDCVTITRSTFKSMLDRLDDEKLKEIADSSFRAYFRKNVLAFSENVDLNSYLTTLEIWARNSGLFDCNVITNGGGLTINVRHEMGRNFSVLLMIYMEKALRSLGSSPDLIADHHSVSARFDLPIQNGVKDDTKAPLFPSIRRPSAHTVARTSENY